MSIAVLAIGALHALPIVFVGAKTRSMSAVLLCAIAVGALAILIGSARFIFVDLLGVVIGIFIGRSFCNLPKVRRVSFKADDSGEENHIQADDDQRANSSDPVTICGIDPTLLDTDINIERNEHGEFESYQAAAQHAHIVAKLSGQVMTVRSSDRGGWLVERGGEFQPKNAQRNQAIIDVDVESQVLKSEMLDDQSGNRRE